MMHVAHRCRKSAAGFVKCVAGTATSGSSIESELCTAARATAASPLKGEALKLEGELKLGVS